MLGFLSYKETWVVPHGASCWLSLPPPPVASSSLGKCFNDLPGNWTASPNVTPIIPFTLFHHPLMRPFPFHSLYCLHPYTLLHLPRQEALHTYQFHLLVFTWINPLTFHNFNLSDYVNFMNFCEVLKLIETYQYVIFTFLTIVTESVVLYYTYILNFQIFNKIPKLFMSRISIFP